MRSLTMLLIAALLFTQYAGCASTINRPISDPAAWDQDVGEKVVIHTTDGTWISGTLLKVGEKQLVLFVKDGPKTVPIAEVEAYSVEGNGRGEPNEDRDLAVILLLVPATLGAAIILISTFVSAGS